MRVALLLLLLVIPNIALAAIVPACAYTRGAICQACDIVAMTDNLLKFFVTMGAFAAAIMLAYAGVLYVTASANPHNIDSAKNIFWKTFIGLILLLVAFLIIDLLLRTFTGKSLDVTSEIRCVVQVQANGQLDWGDTGGQESVETDPQPVLPGPVESGELEHDAARSRFTQCGVAVTSTGGPGNVYAACPANGCTSLQGLRENTVDTTCSLQDACNNQPDCDVIVTGGTECGAHGRGPFGHCTGYKVDIEDTPAFRRFVLNGGVFTHDRTDPQSGYKYYRDKCGNVLIDEGDHFDYQVRVKCTF